MQERIETHSEAMTLSIPDAKLREINSAVDRALRCRSLSRKHLQSILGRLLHIAKCVKPARLFVSRLLDSLKNMKRNFVRVSGEMRRDLEWFKTFGAEWNGVSIIRARVPSRVIEVDASSSSIGGCDGRQAYAGMVTPIDDPVASIAELEAINIIIGLHTFVGKADRGSHILVWSDSMVSVHAFTSGRATKSLF